MMGDQAKSDVSPRLSKRRRRIAFDSNVDGATDSTNIATSGPKLQEDNGNHINDTDVAATDADGDDERLLIATAAEIVRRELLGPQPRSDSATQNNKDKAKKHTATTTLRDPIKHRTDQSKAVIPFLSVPLLDISSGLIQIMYGNTSFEVARGNNIELPDCLCLQYAFQAVASPEAYGVLSEICNLATNECNQVQLCFAGI